MAGAEQALREVSRAAEAVASLARAIERGPNSLIFWGLTRESEQAFQNSAVSHSEKPGQTA
jgi:hypothetical protein